MSAFCVALVVGFLHIQRTPPFATFSAALKDPFHKVSYLISASHSGHQNQTLKDWWTIPLFGNNSESICHSKLDYTTIMDVDL